MIMGTFVLLAWVISVAQIAQLVAWAWIAHGLPDSLPFWGLRGWILDAIALLVRLIAVTWVAPLIMVSLVPWLVAYSSIGQWSELALIAGMIAYKWIAVHFHGNGCSAGLQAHLHCVHNQLQSHGLHSWPRCRRSLD